MFRILITTYELLDKEYVPVLSHIFYGKTLDEAYHRAGSHLITDYFFSSSFVGEMKWKNSVIYMNNKGKAYKHDHEVNSKKVMFSLEKQAHNIINVQDEKEYALVIQEVIDELKV